MLRCNGLCYNKISPEDFTISTGVQYTVRDFVNIAAKELDIKLKWDGSGVDETGVDINTGKTIVRVDSRYFDLLKLRLY